MSLFSNLTARFFSTEIQNQIRQTLAVKETDSIFTYQSTNLWSQERDRLQYDREEVLAQCLEAWRLNPLARRIVSLTSQYVVGAGVAPTCKHRATAKFIEEFWKDPLNRMPIRTTELCDELTRTGNLFILITTDPGGMSYIRAIPATQIDHIESQQNDIEQPIRFYPKGDIFNPNPAPYMAYSNMFDDPSQPVMLHYAINRPVGAQYGESDLAPTLRWLSRYANWLEDRARLNRFRTSFLYVVTGKYISEAERIARQNALNTSRPNPGSILVCDESEKWDVISPKLESHEAGEDGLSLKKMIAAGSGIPMHFLAEPEGSTRTTAEAAGGPTFRHFEQRQEYVLWMLTDILKVIVKRKAKYTPRINPEIEITVKGTDISARDNISLSMASNNIFNTGQGLREKALIDDSEFLRLVYRFAGEAVDVEDMLVRGAKAGPPAWLEPDDPLNVGEGSKPSQNDNTVQGSSGENNKQVDVETGEPKEKAE